MKLNKLNLFIIFLLVCFSFLHLVFTIRTNAYFSLDDFAVLNCLQNHSSFEMISRFLGQGDIWGFKKILGYLNFSLLFNMFGANPIVFIINNYLLHTANIILVFLISLKLSKDSLKSFFVSIIANSLYLTYFSNVHEYLVTFFILISGLLYLHSRIKLSLVSFVLALLSKEIAFTLPFFLLAINHHQKLKERNLQFFMTLAIYVLYQFLVGPQKLDLPLDHPYAISLSLQLVFNNLKFYLPLWLVALSLLFTSPMLLVSLLSLFPSLLLVNRQETYYLYLPLLYFAIYLSVLLPKFKLKNLPVYLLVFILLGGRKILPPIARQNFPNWQKVSIQNVINRVENNVSSKEIDLNAIYLERDAKLMLMSNTLNLFVKKELSSEYNFVYNPDTQTILVIPAQAGIYTNK